MSSDDPETLAGGVARVSTTHLRPGMTLKEVRARFHPVPLDGPAPVARDGVDIYSVPCPLFVEGKPHQGWVQLTFDRGRLAEWEFCGPNTGK